MEEGLGEKVVARLVPLVVDVTLDCRQLEDSAIVALFEGKLEFETLFGAIADVNRNLKGNGVGFVGVSSLRLHSEPLSHFVALVSLTEERQHFMLEDMFLLVRLEGRISGAVSSWRVLVQPNRAQLVDFDQPFDRVAVHERKSLGELIVKSRERAVLERTLFPQIS